jgi:hypothetical protein
LINEHEATTEAAFVEMPDFVEDHPAGASFADTSSSTQPDFEGDEEGKFTGVNLSQVATTRSTEKAPTSDDSIIEISLHPFQVVIRNPRLNNHDPSDDQTSVT